MEIVLAAGGLPFGPDTLSCRPLGGSETAVLQIAEALRARGHQVTVFCRLPEPGAPDHVSSGAVSRAGVRYVGLEHYGAFVAGTEVDLLVGSREPALLDLVHHARKSVLWLHDLATYRHTRPALQQRSWRVDEIWCVSEFHRRQVHDVTGYPLEHLRAVRNGIARFPDPPPQRREDRLLLYAARPERGLAALVRPGGVLDALPGYRLVVTTYPMPGQEAVPSYQELWRLCRERTNVELLPGLAQPELRRLMARASAYVYPTEFEEVSCILARECIEQRLPVVATRVGALPETLGDAAVWAPDTGEGFAAAVRRLHEDPALRRAVEERQSLRTDLYWDDVAAEWERRAEPPAPRTFSLAWSLLADGDRRAAEAALQAAADDRSPALERLRARLPSAAPAPDPAPGADGQELLLRAALEPLPPGARVLWWGASEPALPAVASEFEDLDFTVTDGSVSALDGPFDALVCCGIVERRPEPWRELDALEAHVVPNGPVTVLARSGPWPGARQWNPDPWMLRRLLGGKRGFALRCQPVRTDAAGRLVSLLVSSHRAGGAAAGVVEPLAKAAHHRARQTCAAAVIAMDSEDTVLQMLGSVRGDVQQLQVALGPSSDATEALVRGWAARHPEVDVRIRAVPRIEAGRFGFDDARNESVAGLEADWILWIDTDEYRTGAPVAPYLRGNAHDAYLVHQHHFSTEPRGAPVPTDTPARLFRNDGRMRFYGKVHEQAERGPNGLSGFSMTLPDVDIAHVGYRDEAARVGRFHRNLPFVAWDRRVNPDRLIGKYVWLRDLALQMGAAAGAARQRTADAQRLAREVVEFYRAQWRAFEPAMGGGRAFLGLTYYSQALELLDEGVAVDASIAVADAPPVRVRGRFRDEDEASALIHEVLRPEMERRRSRYWE